ncbi:MAG: EamA family transporter [Actinomycetota bacterium]|nr:EamA family transporter [Actinomycetota bacterium]
MSDGRRIAPLSVGLVLLAIVSIQCGAAIAISIFDRVGFAGAVLLRNLLAVPVLAAIWPPSLRGRAQSDLWLVAAFGVALGVMNLAIYAALDRIPLGVAVTVEFLGPLGVAVFKGRGPLALLWAALAACGVAALAGPFGGSADLLGIAFAAVAAVGWASYILLGGRVGRVFAGASGLTIGVTIAALIQLPAGLASGGSEMVAPAVLGAGAAAAVLSTVVPYAAEIEALRRIPPALFGVLMSLEPAVAALVGLIALDQGLDAGEVAGIALVVVASIGAIRTARLPAPVVD